MILTGRRLSEGLAISMIGDGIVAAFAPRRHSELWATRGRFGDLMRWCAERPHMVRALGLIELGAGLWLARRSWGRMR